MTAQYYIGGLMRCCIAHLLGLDAAGNLPETEGHVVNCKYCGNGMAYRGDGYRWSPEDRKEPKGRQHKKEPKGRQP